MKAILTTMHDWAATMRTIAEPPHRFPTRTDIADAAELEAEITARMADAHRARQPKIVTSWNGLGWTAYRDDYDLGHPVGMSIKNEADAVADLLEEEAAQ